MFEENKSLIDDLDLLVIDPRKREVDYFNEKVREAVAWIFQARDKMER